jgi:hypothetical protein
MEEKCDETVASATSGHETALHLKYRVWFYRIEQMLLWYCVQKKRKELRERWLVFSWAVWYISWYRTYVFRFRMEPKGTSAGVG